MQHAALPAYTQCAKNGANVQLFSVIRKAKTPKYTFNNIKSHFLVVSYGSFAIIFVNSRRVYCTLANKATHAS